MATSSETWCSPTVCARIAGPVLLRRFFRAHVFPSPPPPPPAPALDSYLETRRHLSSRFDSASCVLYGDAITSRATRTRDGEGALGGISSALGALGLACEAALEQAGDEFLAAQTVIFELAWRHPVPHVLTIRASLFDVVRLLWRRCVGPALGRGGCALVDAVMLPQGEPPAEPPTPPLAVHFGAREPVPKEGDAGAREPVPKDGDAGALAGSVCTQPENLVRNAALLADYGMLAHFERGPSLPPRARAVREFVEEFLPERVLRIKPSLVVPRAAAALLLTVQRLGGCEHWVAAAQERLKEAPRDASTNLFQELLRTLSLMRSGCGMPDASSYWPLAADAAYVEVDTLSLMVQLSRAAGASPATWRHLERSLLRWAGGEPGPTCSHGLGFLDTEALVGGFEAACYFPRPSRPLRRLWLTLLRLLCMRWQVVAVDAGGPEGEGGCRGSRLPAVLLQSFAPSRAGPLTGRPTTLSVTTCLRLARASLM